MLFLIPAAVYLLHKTASECVHLTARMDNSLRRQLHDAQLVYFIVNNCCAASFGNSGNSLLRLQQLARRKMFGSVHKLFFFLVGNGRLWLQNSSCGDWHQINVLSQNCSKRFVKSYKISHKSDFDENILVDGETRIIRSCGYIEGKSGKNSCERQPISNANEMRYCQCDEDLCNKSSSQKMARSLALVLLISYWNKVYVFSS